MPTYNPLVPSGTIPLNQDYQNLQDNFNQANVVMGVDHLPFDNATGQKGYHTAIHLVPVSTTVTNMPKNQPIVGYMATAGYGQILSAQINDGLSTDETLFFLSGGNRLYQFHGNKLPVAAANGLSYMTGPGQGAVGSIGAIIVQWGIIPTPSIGDNTVTFATAFPNNCFNIQLTVERAAANIETIVIKTGSISTTGFKAIAPTAGSANIYWIAIGN